MKFLTAAIALGAISLASMAEAMPLDRELSASDLVIRVAGGCGPGWHPNPWGRCVPNRRWGPPPDDYGPPPAYGPPPGYGPRPVYGPPPGYPPPPPPPGYGPPPGYPPPPPPPGYGPPPDYPPPPPQRW